MGQSLRQLFDSHSAILMEAAVLEPLRRLDGVQLHPTLANSMLLYDERGRAALAAIYRDYLQIADSAGLPILLCAPSWRANRERLQSAAIDSNVNRDSIAFMRELCAERVRSAVGGLLGCRYDCYRPDLGLTSAEAEAFHGWQCRELAAAGADFLLAATLPNVDEALGMARAMAGTGRPYLVSFVIGRDGRVLDGTPLVDAITRIDSGTPELALGYMVNCAYPTFLRAAEQPAQLYQRLIGYQANASSLDHCDLDGADELQAESIGQWGDAMISLKRDYGMKILGGCCGTGGDHLRYLVRHWEETVESGSVEA